MVGDFNGLSTVGNPNNIFPLFWVSSTSHLIFTSKNYNDHYEKWLFDINQILQIKPHTIITLHPMPFSNNPIMQN